MCTTTEGEVVYVQESWDLKLLFTNQTSFEVSYKTVFVSKFCVKQLTFKFSVKQLSCEVLLEQPVFKFCVKPNWL